MGCGKNVISSNVTGLSYAEETDLNELPDGGEGTSTEGALSASTEITDIVPVLDIPTNRLTITGTIIASETDAIVRVNRLRDAVTDENIGSQVEINSPSTFNGFDPVLGVGAWTGAGEPGTTDLIVVVDLGSTEVGDVFTVEFDVVDTFAGAATITVTVDTIGTGTAEWYVLEPNEYDDLGAEIETVAREPINASRQKKKGVVVDLDAEGGFTTDITQTNIVRLMQGFFFAKAHERFTTNPINNQYANTPVLVSVSGTDITFADDITQDLPAGSLLELSGFSNSDNNGVVEVLSVAGPVVTTDGALTAEGVSADTKVETVGFSLTSGATAATVVGGKFVLTNATDDFNNMGFQVGEWIFVGGDAAGSFFALNAQGFARIVGISATELQLDEVSWSDPIADTGAGVSLRLSAGTVIRNEKDPSLIICQTYQLERQLGTDADGVQAEYLVGAVANEFQMNIPSVEKLTGDLSFVGLDSETRTGAEGLKPGDRIDLRDEDAFNTSSNVYQMRLYVHDDSQVTPGSLFGFVLEGDVTINNNATGLKAIGTLGSFDVNVGDFEVTGELNVYFATVAAIDAVRNNADVGFNVICTKNNAGFVFDIPLVSLGGGRLDVEKDSAIMLPLEKMGAENEWGYTMLSTWFASLPNVAMTT